MANLGQDQVRSGESRPAQIEFFRQIL